MGDRASSQRDYVVPAIVGAVAVVAIVAGTLVGLTMAKRDDALLLVGALGTIGVTPIFAVLLPLIKSVNRAAAANQATAEGVESIKHSLNGGFEDRVKRAVSEALGPLRQEVGDLRYEIAAMKNRLAAGDQKFDAQAANVAEVSHQVAAVKRQIEQLTNCETKPEGQS
jgi:ABC-type transporter Mla subunit MlaD